MRFLRLDLLAFGPFTALSLPLEQGEQGLHIIHGPNEAGKSSSLRALRQFLYGIETKSPDNFLHAYPKMRIGGVIEDALGKRLELIRRKGAKNTLLGADGVETVDESLLQGMLGGVDEVMFRQRFGIDYEELRRGGEAVVRGGGDLGEMLFAAGAGLADVGAVRDTLEKEADDLFNPHGRASKQKVNEALSALTEARKTIKDSQLSTSAWVEHDKALRTAESRQTELDGQLLKARTQYGHLERVAKALPLIVRRERLEQELAQVAEAPLLPADFANERSKAVTELANAEKAERDAVRAIEKLQEEISQLDVAEHLLEHHTAIQRLRDDLGSFRKADKDRPGLVAKLENVERRTRDILDELGRNPELEQAGTLRLNKKQRRRIQTLGGDYKARLDRQHATALVVGKLREQIQRLDGELAALPPPCDVDALEQAIRRAEKQGDLDRRWEEARHSLKELDEQSRVDLQKFRLWNGSLDELERLAVPSLETIERFEDELSDAASAVEKIEQRIEELERLVPSLDQSLERLQLEHDVPTVDDLAAVRGRRDRGWKLIQRVWRESLPADDPAVAEFLGEAAAGDDLAQGFQASLDAADALADRLRREADRVAEMARLTAERQQLQRELGGQQEKLTTAKQELQRRQAAWHGVWGPLNIEPLPPREMRSWINQQRTLAETARGIRRQRDVVGATGDQIRTLREDLNGRLRELGEPERDERESLAATLAGCESVVSRFEKSNQQRTELERTLKQLREELPGAEAEAEQARNELETWTADWAAAIAALGLEHDASPLEASAVMDAVDEMTGLVKEAGELRERIEGIDRDAGEFRRTARRLLELVAEDLCELPVDLAVAGLYDRSDAASTARTKLEEWQRQLKAEEAKRDSALSDVEQWRIRIASMCAQAGCASSDELPAAEQRSSLRADVEGKLQHVNEQLEELSAGTSLDEFIAEAGRFDPDQLQAELPRLENEIARLDGERIEVAQAVAIHGRELQRMDGSGKAAEAQEQAEHLLARIRDDAEQYVRLRLASLVLRRAIDRFRDASQGPILSRAGELFAELTLGAFSGVRPDYVDRENPVLVGVRPGGQTVGVDGMSAGTCDQLYLALRLALLESYLEAHEPLPLIVDDILVMFDDRRAVAALKALAELSGKTQVIFFTHHEHLVELAREHLDGGIVFTHTLDHRLASPVPVA